MGSAIAHMLYNSYNNIFVYDKNIELLKVFQNKKYLTIKDMLSIPDNIDIIWLMIPYNQVSSAIDEILKNKLKKNTIIIDGGNSYYKESIKRYNYLKNLGINFIDCGTSGGLNGASIGFSMTIGGDYIIFNRIIEIFKILSGDKGSYLYVGNSGSGHFVKMIHNAIEYTLLEGYAQGFNLLKNGFFKDINIEAIIDCWQNGAIIRSFILDLFKEVYKDNLNLNNISGEIGENGTGRWAFKESKKYNINFSLLKEALNIREKSREGYTDYSTKLVSLVRHIMGGHSIEQNLCTKCREKL